MNIQLSQNIRTYRKEGGYTQEQLAEALGVTVGAVSKWETGLSVPDISLIVELADFFETSVDVLLGYEWRLGSMGEMAERIHNARITKDYEQGAKEAEKALQKFPNAFEVVYQSGKLYESYGIDTRQGKFVKRAIELLRKSLKLIAQNKDETIDEYSIMSRIASLYLMSGQSDEAIKTFKEYNAGGQNNGMIGFALATYKKDYEQAIPYLSDYLVETLVNMYYCCCGYVNAYIEQKKYADAIDIIHWMKNMLLELKIPGKVGFLDKLELTLLMSEVVVLYNYKPEQIPDCLRRVKKLAVALEKSDDYGMTGIRHYYGTEKRAYADWFGKDVMLSIEEFLSGTMYDEPVEKEEANVLLQLWEDIKNEGEQ